MEPRRAGMVAGITRYPVKSMRGEALGAAELHWPWLLGDRQYAFVKLADRSSFPWLTARDLPELVRWEARYDRPADPIHSGVTVSSPDGETFDIRDPALPARLGEAARAPVGLLRLGRGCFDAMAVSVLLATTVAALERAHGAPLGAGRFRANLLIEPEEPVAEADWVGRSAAIGAEGTRLSLDWATPRCAMVGIDPAHGTRDPAVVRTVARQFSNRVGTYCAVERPGPVRVGDAIVLTSTFPVTFPVTGAG